MNGRFRVVISDQASADLRAIHAYVAADSPDRATDLLASLVRQIDGLDYMPSSYPRKGRRATTGDPVHMTHHKSFRLYFGVSIQPATVTVLTVRHGARRQPRRFG